MRTDIVQEFRERHGLYEDFAKWVKSVLKMGILEQYRKAFEVNLEGSGLSWQDVGSTLGVNRGTISRWMNGQKADFDSIILFVATQDTALGEVGFPKGSDAILGGLAKTLMAIVSRFPDAGDGVIIHDHQVALLRFVLDHPRVIELGLRRESPGATMKSTSSASRGITVGELIDEFRSRCPHYQPAEPWELMALCRAWFIPWVLIRDTVDYPWIRNRSR